MKAKIILIIIVNLMLNVLKKNRYDELERTSSIYLRQEDLPCEFGGKALDVINDFIQKTHDRDYEVVMYFDYVTGEIIDYAFGEEKGVKIDFDDVDFKEKHIVSIHNHPPTVYSPPSDKNFSILLRSFEDYELVASVEGLWILKAIGINPILNMDFKFYAERILEICQEHCDKLYSDPIKADEVCDRMYGVSLSNYINDKNINDIQLTKREYSNDH